MALVEQWAAGIERTVVGGSVRPPRDARAPPLRGGARGERAARGSRTASAGRGRRRVLASSSDEDADATARGRHRRGHRRSPRRRRTAPRRPRLQTAWAVLMGWWAALCAVLATVWRRWAAVEPPMPVRLALAVQLDAARRGEAARDPLAWLGRGVGGQGRIRGTRSVRTAARHAAGLRLVGDWLDANVDFGVDVGRADAAVWDAVLEAVLTTRVAPRVAHCHWQRPRHWPAVVEPQTAWRAVTGARAGLSVLGYAAGPWHRLEATATALGCRDPEDVVRVEPIFAAELWDGLRGLEPPSLWHLAARALLTLSVCLGGRPGTCTAVEVGDVAVERRDTVAVRMVGFRHKPQHERATRRGRRTAPAVSLRHWAVAAYVQPWLDHVLAGEPPPSQLLFPSIVRAHRARAVSAAGWVEDGLRFEPTRPWSGEQVAAALEWVLGAGRGGRTAQGIRAGANMEMSRLGADFPPTRPVPAVVRRAVQGRSLREQLGSEAAYYETFADQTQAAVSQLGSLRIRRARPGQPLAVVAVSPSAGQLDDYVVLARPAVVDGDGSDSGGTESPGGDDVAAPGAPPAATVAVRRPARGRRRAEESSTGEETDAIEARRRRRVRARRRQAKAAPAARRVASDSAGSARSDAATSAAGQMGVTRVRGDACGRCQRPVLPSDHGWFCEESDCSWGVCTRCHRGGQRRALRCPEHTPGD